MTNPLARQLSIDFITDTPNPIIEWFSTLWSTLLVIETDVYHDEGGELIYYRIVDGKKQWIFYQDSSTDYWCNDELYWTFLVTQFKVNWGDISAITKVLVENSLQASIAEPLQSANAIYYEVKTALDASKSIPIVNALNYL